MKRPLAYITAPWSNNQYENAENAATSVSYTHLVSREILAQMLSTYRFIIFVAYLVDMSQYRMNHDETIETITEI